MNDQDKMLIVLYRREPGVALFRLCDLLAEKTGADAKELRRAICDIWDDLDELEQAETRPAVDASAGG